MKPFSSLIKVIGSLALSAFIIFASLHFVSAQGTSVFQGPDGQGCYQSMYYQTPQEHAAYGCSGSFFDEECGAGGGGGVPCSGFGYCQIVDCSSGNPGETTNGGGSGPATITVNNSCNSSSWSSSTGHTSSPFSVSPSASGQSVSITPGSLPAGYSWNPVIPSSSQVVYPDGSAVFNLSCSPLVVDATLSASPNPYQCTGATTLTWDSDNASYCTGSWGGGNLATSGTQSISPTGTQSYTVTCHGAGGTSDTASVTVSEAANSCPVGPATVSISTNPSSVANAGDDSVLSWDAENVSGCNIQQLPSYPGYTWPNVPADGSITINPYSNTTYIIVCSAISGNNPASNASVTVPPVVDVSASPTSGVAGTVNPTITWTTTNSPASCTATGDWSGSKSVSGSSQSMGVLSTVKTYTYTLACTNSAGTGTDTATVAVSGAATIDLTAGNITPTTATVGTQTTFSSIITNSGNSSTVSSFSNYFRLATVSNGGGNPTDIGTVTSPAIAGGASRTVTQLYTFSTPGTYSLRACADKSGAGNAGTITETNENNNCGSWVDITVLDVPPVVTLAASPTSGYAGTVNPTLTWSATNNPTGCTASGSWSGAQASSGSQSLGVIATPGTYTYTLSCVNSGGTGSATATVTVTAAPTPDLVSSNAAPSSAVAGTPVNLTAIISNNGTADVASTDSFYNLFHIATDLSNPGTTIKRPTPPTMTGMPRNTSSTITASYTFAAAGTYYIRGCADKLIATDATGMISESDESNNCSPAWTTVTVSPAGATGPDLTASTVTPISATVGAPTTFSATITNSGNASTGASFSNFLQVATATNGGGTVTDLVATTMSTLASGANNTATKSYTFSAPGTYSMRACADKSSSANAGTIAESNENNNCSAWTDITIPSLGPVVAISANPTSGYANVVNSTLTWSATNNPTCVASGSWSGSKNASGIQQTGVLVAAGTYTYILTCTNAGGQGTASTTVTVTGPPAGAASILVTSNKSNASWTIAPNGLSGSGTSGGPYYVVPASGGTIYTITPAQIPNYTLVVTNTVTNTASNSFALGVGDTGRFDLTYTNLAGDFDYSLSTASGDTNIVEKGTPQYGQRVINKTLVGGSTQSVDLTLSGVPAGVTYSFANQLCSPTCATTINFTVSPTAPAGTYPITVTGSPLGKTTSFNLVITGSNAVLVSCFASPSPARVGEVVTWSSTVSGGTPPYASYVWTGSAPIPTSPAPDTPSFNVTYTTTGQKNALLTVTDSNGVVGSCSVPQAVLQVNFNPNFEEF